MNKRQQEFEIKRLRFTEKEIQDALSLRDEGLSIRAIAKKLNRSKTGIHKWITIFAEESGDPDMNKKRLRAPKPKEKVKRAVGLKAPEEVEVSSKAANQPSENLEEKVKRLEEELRKASLMRDFYDEMINVAEKQFNINIRKKAGTRQ